MHVCTPGHKYHCLYNIIIFQCQEKYLIKFNSPCLTQPPKGYTIRYTYPNGKHEAVKVESVKRDELIVFSSPSNLTDYTIAVLCMHAHAHNTISSGNKCNTIATSYCTHDHYNIRMHTFVHV